VLPGQPAVDFEPGERVQALALRLHAGRQRAQVVQRLFGRFVVPAGHGDMSADHERPEPSERRQVQAEDLVQDLQGLVPATGRGQGLGQVRGDRRRDLPPQAELPGPGQALPARRNGELVTAASLERVGDAEVGPRLEQPEAGPLGRLLRAAQGGYGVLAPERSE
jgi:hypothetical protein